MRKGLDDAALGPLESAADAKRWTVLVARSVATGALSAEQGRTVLAAVTAFLKAHEAGELEEKLAAWEAAQDGRR